MDMICEEFRYDHGLLMSNYFFVIFNLNALLFWPCVNWLSLVMWSDAKPKLFWVGKYGHVDRPCNKTMNWMLSIGQL